MRTGWVIGGLIVLILGFVLWYIPVNISAGSNDVPAASGVVVEANPPLALLSSNLPYTATWSSDLGIPVNVSAYSCGTDSTCSHATDKVASGTGTTGTLTWSGSKGTYYVIIPTSKTSISVNVGEPVAGGIAGLALVVIGLIVLLAGAARKSKMRPAPQPVNTEPAQTEGS